MTREIYEELMAADIGVNIDETSSDFDKKLGVVANLFLKISKELNITQEEFVANAAIVLGTFQTKADLTPQEISDLVQKYLIAGRYKQTN